MGVKDKVENLYRRFGSLVRLTEESATPTRRRSFLHVGSWRLFLFPWFKIECIRSLQRLPRPSLSFSLYPSLVVYVFLSNSLRLHRIDQTVASMNVFPKKPTAKGLIFVLSFSTIIDYIALLLRFCSLLLTLRRSLICTYSACFLTNSIDSL